MLAVLCLTCPAAGAANRSTLIAMAVALLDVAEEHCEGRITIDGAVKARLMVDFREYDISGIGSVISGPLNSFYEEFLLEARKDLRQFCARTSVHAAATGYPVIALTE
jgi:hypothetical protein